MAISIRQAVPEDAEQVLAMLHQLFDEPYLNISRATFRFGVQEEREFLERIVQGDSDVYFVAVDESGEGEPIVGNIWMRGSVSPLSSHRAEVAIGVVPSHQGRGIGTRLMQAGLAWARERGLARVELTVHCDNEGARRLYERFGFVLEGRHRALFQKDGRFTDAFSMALALEPASKEEPAGAAQPEAGAGAAERAAST